MSKKIVLSLAAVAAMSATSAMAQYVPTNPWQGTQTTVPITVTVQPMIELFMDTTVVPLQIVDAGENQGSNKAVSRIVNHIHNVPATISAELDGEIPDNTQFHILINPATTWTAPTASGAQKTLSWRKEGGVYQAGATGAFPGQVTIPGPNISEMAFTDGSNAGGGDTTMPIQYFADSRNVMASVNAPGGQLFNVLWTITTP